MHVKSRQLRPIACVCRSPILQALFREGRLGRGAGSPMVTSLIVQPTSPPSDADAFTSAEHPLARSAYADLGPASIETSASGGLDSGSDGPLAPASAAAPTEGADEERTGDKEQTLPQTDESEVFMHGTREAECASDSNRDARENAELARPPVEHQSSCTADCALLEAALSCEEDTDTTARYEAHPTQSDTMDAASLFERSDCSETRGIGGESDPPPPASASLSASASASRANYSRAMDASASAGNAASPELHPFSTPTPTQADIQKETEPSDTADDVEAPREVPREAPDESMGYAMIERNSGTEQRKRGDGIDGEEGIEGVFPGVGASAAAVEQLEEDSSIAQMQNTPMSSQPLPALMQPDSPSASVAPSFPEAPEPPVDGTQCNEQPASPMSVDSPFDKSPGNLPAPKPMEPTLTDSSTAATSCAPPCSADPEDQEEPAIAATVTGAAEWSPHLIRSMSLRSDNATDASAYVRTEQVEHVSEPVPLCSTSELQPPSMESLVMPTEAARSPMLRFGVVREEDEEEEVESPAVLETQIQSRLALLRAADETAAEPTPDTYAGSLAAHYSETTFVAFGGTAPEGLTPVTSMHEDDSEEISISIGETRGHSEQPVGFLSTTEEAEEAAEAREARRRESKLRALRTPDPHPHSDHNSFEDSDPGPVNDEDDLSNDDGDSL